MRDLIKNIKLGRSVSVVPSVNEWNDEYLIRYQIGTTALRLDICKIGMAIKKH